MTRRQKMLTILLSSAVTLGVLHFVRAELRVRGARKTCEDFMTLRLTGHCHEAYRLTIASMDKYNSTEDSFCRDLAGAASTSASASCGNGEWHDVAYTMFGHVTRPEMSSLSFGMDLKRTDEGWRVRSFSEGE
jgi:hypothetical protein